MALGLSRSKMRIAKALRGNRGLLAGALLALTVGAGSPVLFAGGRTPTYAQVREAYRASDSWIVDRNDRAMESVRIAKSHRTLDWTPWSEVSPSFQLLLVRSEDKRFFSHIGVDPLALARVSRRRGASTLTMQLANLIAKGRHQFSKSAAERKFDQIFEALRLDHQWTKPQILEAYVNLVPFRGELVGLRAAAMGMFGKAPLSLDENESAILVALIRSPNAPPAAVASRACGLVGSKGVGSGADPCAAIRERTEKTLAAAYQIPRSRDLIPVLSQSFVVSERSDDGVIKTSLDRPIQELAVSAAREQLRELKAKNVGDAAVIVMRTSTGEILAYVGNAGPGFSTASQIDGVHMRRQAGSTLKPFVYATAFDLNLLTKNSLVEDSPEDLAVGGGGIYSPKNYDHSFQGLVAAGEALGSSLNVPAVRTLELTKESRVLDRMHALGFTELMSDDHYGPSLALGTVDVSLQELTNAYRQLSSFAKDKEVFSGDTKKQVFASLSAPEYRRFTFGLSSLLGLPFPAAVKTGTSKDMRDNWCVGYTSEYTVGVWVGNFNGEPMWNVSGLTGAAPIWRNLMMSLHAGHPNQDLAQGYEPPNEPLIKRSITRIRYPQANMLIGLDPDIPKAKQRLPIQIQSPQSSQSIFVDGKKLARAEETVFWNLTKGRHQVELKTSDGRRVDDVSFVVR